MSIGRIITLLIVLALILSGIAACIIFKPSLDVSARPSDATGVRAWVETEEP